VTGRASRTPSTTWLTMMSGTRKVGASLMPPLGRYELALEVLDGLKR
jgi:hypothetical protein